MSAEFDQYAKEYRQLHNDNLKITGFNSFHFIDVKMQWLTKHEQNTNLHVLDLGCGDGYTAEYMRKYFSNWKIEGIEVSEESITECINKNISNCNFQWFDGRFVPFKDESFDVVFCACTFHHIPLTEHKDLLLEAKRILKKGGRLYLFEHNPYNIGTQYLVKTCVFDGGAHLLPASYFNKILEQQNWQINFVKYIVFFPGWSVFKPLHSLEKYLSWLPLGGQYFISATK